MPHTKPGLQFNSPSVASLKYYPRNEIRDPEYRVWSSTGSRMKTWPYSVAKRHALEEGGGLNPLPKWHGYIFALLHLAVWTHPLSPFPITPLRSSKSWHSQPGRAPNPRQKVSPRCQRSQKFNNLERMGFAFLKPLGHHLESHTHTVRAVLKKKTLSNGLCASQWFEEKNFQNSTSGLCRLLRVSVPYSLTFFPHNMAGF